MKALILLLKLFKHQQSLIMLIVMIKEAGL